MEIFGIGLLELLLILLISFLVLGPGDMVKTGRTIGRFLRRVVTSVWWNDLRRASRELRQLPYTLMREANLEDAAKDLNEIKAMGNLINPGAQNQKKSKYSSWTSPIIPGSTPSVANQATNEHQAQSGDARDDSPTN